MHIKQLTIHGFKSYRDQVVVGPFSAGLNVVVGRNGSGKSNFFGAIRFVLNDAYSKLGQEERQALLHEGSGSSQIAAYVEIVFDNAEGRFPTGREEVTIRRTVGLKKDEYSVDRKPVTKADVMNLLESAGFSKSNPYYIVPQGRITALTNARDADRLQLLKEVAGTRVYEEHRGESLKIMEQTEGKKAKIVELLTGISERLDELEAEKAELGDYFRLDGERRACEHLIHGRELEKITGRLSALEEEFREAIQAEERDAELGQEHHDRIGQMEGSLMELLRSIDAGRVDAEQLAGDLEAAALARGSLELAHGDLAADLERFTVEEGQVQGALLKVDKEITVHEEQLGRINPQVAALEAQETKAKGELSAVQQERQALNAKKSRLGQFRSEADRNRWLQKELEGLQADGRAAADQRANLVEEYESYKQRHDDLEAELAAMEATDPMARVRELEAQAGEARRQRDAATECRKDLWRAQAKLEGTITGLADELQRLGRDATSSPADKGAMSALEALERVAARLGVADQVYGPLHRLFRVEDPVFNVAVDAIAGGSLHHVVVSDDQVASALLEAMVKERAGRVTLMPLNRLSKERLGYELNPEEALPMLARLQFAQVFQPAMQHVFGRAVICKDLHVGARIAREHRVDAITLSGDRASRKGALTGGSTGQRKGAVRIEALSKLEQCRAKLGEHQETLRLVKDRILATDQQVTLAIGRIQTLGCQLEDLRMSALSSGSKAALRSELEALQRIVTSKAKLIAELEETLRQTEARIAGLTAELASPFASAMSPLEGERLTALNAQFDRLSAEYGQISSELSSLLTQQGASETHLDVNLRRKRHALLCQLSVVDTQHTKEEMARIEGEITEASQRITRLRAAQKKTRGDLERMEKEEVTLRNALEAAKALLEIPHDNSQAMAKYNAKRRLLLQQKQDATDRLRSLGLLPDANTTEFLATETTSALISRLHTLKEEVRQFGPVNKKAIEQHQSFAKQAEALQTRLTDLEASARAIQDFINVLDGRKDEAIQRTYDQVSSSFSHVFGRLVPTGHARLEMIKSAGEADDLVYSGISIRASFSNTEGDEGLLLTQLSGGQKSLLALALILAIQQADPAPFYLFDEVDAALDAAHRTALASLLDDLQQAKSGPDGSSTQFICTTFRQEMLHRADKFFGVSFGSRVSRVEEISRDQALGFVQTETTC